MNKRSLLKWGLISRMLKDVRLLAALLKDYWKGVYRDVSLRSIIFLVLAIAYVLSPYDLLSDFIPVLGQLDDLAVLMACLYALEKDLFKYQTWKNRRSPP